MLTMTPAAIEDPDVTALIRALDEELTELYQEPGHFRLDADEIAPGRGVFLIARLDGAAVGCGAMRLIDSSTAEIKRMFTLPPYRGRGVGGAILSALEAEARRLAATRIVLETGLRQPAAIALYESHGFAHIPAFGEYIGDPTSFCMAKELVP